MFAFDGFFLLGLWMLCLVFHLLVFFLCFAFLFVQLALSCFSLLLRASRCPVLSSRCRALPCLASPALGCFALLRLACLPWFFVERTPAFERRGTEVD